MPQRRDIQHSLSLIFQGIEQLKQAFPNRAFTIDGRLVGDVGEIIASIEYDIVLDTVSRPVHDATTSDGRQVQIKATFKDSLTFRSTPDYYLGLQLFEDGRHAEIYNGPGQVIFDRYQHRRGIGVNLLSFPTTELRILSQGIVDEERIPLRGA
jgi:hypothetical protein